MVEEEACASEIVSRASMDSILEGGGTEEVVAAMITEVLGGEEGKTVCGKT